MNGTKQVDTFKLFGSMGLWVAASTETSPNLNCQSQLAANAMQSPPPMRCMGQMNVLFTMSTPRAMSTHCRPLFCPSVGAVEETAGEGWQDDRDSAEEKLGQARLLSGLLSAFRPSETPHRLPKIDASGMHYECPRLAHPLPQLHASARGAWYACPAPSLAVGWRTFSPPGRTAWNARGL